jgi:hypothetical protein
LSVGKACLHSSHPPPLSARAASNNLRRCHVTSVHALCELSVIVFSSTPEWPRGKVRTGLPIGPLSLFCFTMYTPMAIIKRTTNVPTTANALFSELAVLSCVLMDANGLAVAAAHCTSSEPSEQSKWSSHRRVLRMHALF